jgi:hypothetical protein
MSLLGGLQVELVFVLFCMWFGCASYQLRISRTTGAATTVCRFSTADRNHVAAFISQTVIAHFYGTTSPVMELISMAPGTQTGGPCATTYVPVLHLYA